MSAQPGAMERLEERFTEWAKQRDDIRAAMVIGSRARYHDRPADEFSDLDVVIVAKDPERYLGSGDWLSELGNPILTFVEPTATGGGRERRVLFEDGTDADFSVFPDKDIRALLYVTRLRGTARRLDRILPQKIQHTAVQHAEEIRYVVGRGFRILFDKDGAFTVLMKALMAAGMPVPKLPTEDEFLQVVNDYWYHALWTARKLRRGELWVAHSCLDGYMKNLLLRMISWRAQTTKGRGGRPRDTWHGGRFLEQWAGASMVEALRGAFAHYDPEDMRRALFVTNDIFRRTACETAEKLELTYPWDVDRNVTRRVEAVLVPGRGRADAGD